MISHFCIERPIFAAVLSIMLVIAGLAAMFTLPIAQYPDITPPGVTVSATFPGANAETLLQSVAAPIETQVNGVDNMIYMSPSSASIRQMSLSVYAGKPGEDLMKMSMQGRDTWLDVHRARGIGGTQLRLPDNGWPPRVTVRFHGFPALEAFTADAASGRLECMLQRPETRAPEYVCKFGAEQIDALSQREGVFLVSLPARMLVSANERITLRWVDQWR